MGYYYYGPKNKKIVFEDDSPPAFSEGGIVVLSDGTHSSIFEEKGFEVLRYHSFGDFYHIKATVPELNELFEGGLAKIAQPILLERLGGRL
jgi:hypothetical protein